MWKIWSGNNPFLLRDRQNKRQSSHLNSLSSLKLDFSINTIGCINKLFCWMKRKWLLSATGEIQTEHCTGHTGSWKFYRLAGLDAVCLVLYASLQCSLRTLIYGAALFQQNTDIVTTYTIPHTRKMYWWIQSPPLTPTPLGCFAACYDFQYERKN